MTNGRTALAAVICLALAACTTSSKDDEADGGDDMPAAAKGVPTGSSGGASGGGENGSSPTGGADEHAAKKKENLEAYMRSLVTGDVVTVDGAAASSDAQRFAELFFLVASGGGIATASGSDYSLCATTKTFVPTCLTLGGFAYDAIDEVDRFDVDRFGLAMIGRSTRSAPLQAGKYAVTTLRGYMRFLEKNQLTVVVGYSWLENQKTLGCDPKTATYSQGGVKYPALAAAGGGGDGNALNDPTMHMLFGTASTGGTVSVKCYDASNAFETHSIVVI